jgi:hypothetical protein
MQSFFYWQNFIANKTNAKLKIQKCSDFGGLG